MRGIVDLRYLQVILRNMQNEKAILSILRTETQRDLLAHLFFVAERPPTLSELARAIRVDQTTVMREVNRLLEGEILSEERVGRSRTVRINEASPFAGPLRQMIRVAGSSDSHREQPEHVVLFQGGDSYRGSPGPSSAAFFSETHMRRSIRSRTPLTEGR